MAETTALEKHSCPACGAQATWNAGKQALICPYCGTESPYEIDATSGEIREIDLVATLRDMPEDLRGWRAANWGWTSTTCARVWRRRA